MRPLTQSIPKALIPVCGKPFIDHQLTLLSKSGITDVVLSIGYRGDMIKDVVGNGSKWNLRVEYVDEGGSLRGTGGALRLCADSGVLHDSFLVTYGDSFLPIDYSSVWYAFEAQKLPAMMVVFRNSGRFDKSNVWFAEGKINLYDKFNRHPELQEKLQYIDYGLSVFQKSLILESIPTGATYDLAELFYAMSRNSKLAGFEVNERFYEIGSPDGLHDFSAFVEAQPIATIPLS
jgi:NDP-sugar pyrophosphorylase family protein